jgi:hypothetical protein
LLDIRPLVGGALVRSAQFSQAILFTSGDSAVAVGAHAVESLQRIEIADLDAWRSMAETPASAAVRGQTVDGATIIDMRALIADVRLVVDDRIGPAEHASSGEAANAG